MSADDPSAKGMPAENMSADIGTRYPWTQPVWERTAGAPDTLHHGLLITGVPGIAKREFAMALGQLLLCGNPADDRQPCGQCQNCALFRAGTHPDFHVLATELEWRDGRVATHRKILRPLPRHRRQGKARQPRQGDSGGSGAPAD